MGSLLRADFFRMWKSKSTIIGLIVCAAAPVLIVLLYLLVGYLTALTFRDTGYDAPDLNEIINARIIIGSIFQPGSNVGLVIPMFAAIFVCTDISSGMLRNKIIAGKPRFQIFLSYMICSAFICMMMVILYASLMTGLSLVFFKYQVELNAEEVINLVYYFVSGLIAFLFLSTVSLFFSLVTGNSALSIVFTILFSFGIGVITILLSAIPNDNAEYFLSLVPTYTSFLNTGGAENTVTFIEGLASMIGFGAINAIVAYNIFARKELK